LQQAADQLHYGAMRHYGLRMLLFFLPVVLFSQQYGLREIPVTGLPTGARVVSYAVVEAEDGQRLVTEIETSDGVSAFYVFVHAEATLIATLIGPRTIPAQFLLPPTHRPVTRRIEGEARRYWEVETSTELVSAPQLEELRFSQTDEGAYPLSPTVGSSLSLSLLRLQADGELGSLCVLEPNILAVTDRLTTTGGWRIRPFDESLLLIGVGESLTAGRGEIRPRLYNSNGELVAVSPARIPYEVNRVPDLLQTDLNGDGVAELIMFPTADSGAALLVLEPTRNDRSARVLSFNLCTTRMNGEDVVGLQRHLDRGGYDLGPNGVDGWYGPDTRAAVIRWQRATDQVVTGVVDLDQVTLQ